MILSILIPTLPERAEMFYILMQHIELQRENHCLKNNYRFKPIEILSDDRGREISTGEKRNDLLARANGEWIWFIDDDDWIADNAIDALMDALINFAPDVIGMNGWMSTNGTDEKKFEIRIGHPYQAIQKDGREYYLRFPNHITPMKRSLASKVKFPNITIFEDYNWAVLIKQMGLLKTQYVIETPLYHYRFTSK